VTDLSRCRPAFDRAYMQAMVKDHVQDIGEFRKEARHAQDPDIKTFALNTCRSLKST
jgi:predicted outer membrane protein